MKLSAAAFSMLLLLAGAQALPTERDDYPPFVDPHGVKAPQARSEISGAAAGNAVGEITDRVTGLINDAQAPKDDWEEQEKLLKALAENRRIVVDRLLHAQEVQSDAEAKARSVQYKLIDANRDIQDLTRELTGLQNESVVLEKRLNATALELDGARKAKGPIQEELFEAFKEKNEAVADANELRKAIAQIDEAIKNID